MRVSPFFCKRAASSGAGRRGFAFLLSILLALPLIPLARASAQAAGGAAHRRAKLSEAEFVPGEVLVRFRPLSAVVAKSDRLSRMLPLRLQDGRDIPVEVTIFGGSELVEGLRLARVPAEDTLRAVESMNARPDVEFAEPNYIWRRAALPNDTQFGALWAQKNTGQVGNNDLGCPANQACPQPGVVGEDIDAELAWNTTTGNRSVVVAVLDGGVDVTHPDLQPNIWTNPGEVVNNGLDDDSNGFIDDSNGWDFHHDDKTVFDAEEGDDHATHVAGTIGAVGNNGQGVTGINWQVSIMSVKVLGPSGGSTSNIIDGYNYVRTMRERGIDVRVMNNSYGGPGFSQSAFLAIQQLDGAGILFVAAAGNDAQDTFSFPHFPSDFALPNIVSVAATDRFGQMAIFSNFGARTVDVGAPGRGILSTVPAFFSGNGTITENGAKYAFFSGTSMATPHISGGAALVLSQNPNISLQNLRGALVFSGDVLPSLQGKTTTGRRLNAFNSLQSASENDTTPPAAISDFRIASQNGRSVTLAWTAPGDDGSAGRGADYDFVFINSTTGVRTVLPTTAQPEQAGTSQSATVDVPYRNFAGAIELRTFDNAGNISAASVGVTVSVNPGSDPYVQTLGNASGLSTGGTALNLIGDDVFREGFSLPFAFPFFGQTRNSITVSSNGALYFSSIPRDGDIGLDAGSSIAGLTGQIMIAGLWDDIRTDRRAGDDVYVVTPDANTIIFRWQGVTFDTPLGGGQTRGEQPVNFEIELRRDGKIMIRYGAGQSSPTNTRLLPVVGISAGEPDAYVVDSHTSESSLKDLTNAETVTLNVRQAAAPNAIDDPESFVRQHYRDFFNREADAAGLAFWTGQITSCGSNPQCVEEKRINVSAAFFISIEFQNTGYLVYRFHRASFPNSLPSYQPFLNDLQRIGAGVVVGAPGWEQQLENNKQAFVREWVQRAAFTSQFPNNLSAGQYVDALFANAEVTPSTAERNAALDAYNGGSDEVDRRARALRSVADTGSVYNKQYNLAFVQMQYFGYLRRDPDQAGFQFWLNKLNQFSVPGEDVRDEVVALNRAKRAEMVKAFIVSGEYRGRFGPS